MREYPLDVQLMRERTRADYRAATIYVLAVELVKNALKCSRGEAYRIVDTEIKRRSK